MNIYLKNLRNKLSLPEKNGKKIGLYRTICAIFGGFFIATLSMSILISIISGTIGENLTLSIILNSLVWASISLWISLSGTKWIALVRAVIPTFIMTIILIILHYS